MTLKGSVNIFSFRFDAYFRKHNKGFDFIDFIIFSYVNLLSELKSFSFGQTNFMKFQSVFKHHNSNLQVQKSVIKSNFFLLCNKTQKQKNTTNNKKCHIIPFTMHITTTPTTHP